MQGSWEKKNIERVHNVGGTPKKGHRIVTMKEIKPQNENVEGPKKKTLILHSETLLMIVLLYLEIRYWYRRNWKKKIHAKRFIVLSLSRQTFTKRHEDVLLDSDEISVTSLLKLNSELQKSYMVRLSIHYS